MESPTTHLLKRLAEIGLSDIIEEYHAYNRLYQKHLTIQKKENMTAKRQQILNATEEVK